MKTLAEWAALQTAIIDCQFCPELRKYAAEVAQQKKRAYADTTYWAKPVPTFGDPSSRLALVGLAPGAHGSNRTGRMFTGDSSGDFLFPALYRAGFASQPNATNRDDGMQLHDCVITAAARCVPPKNMPTPAQRQKCLPYLQRELAALRNLRVIIGLGRIGFDAMVKALEQAGALFERARPKFGHGVEYDGVMSGRTITVLGCYHPSRQNTNTGVLTSEMMDAVLERAKTLLTI